MYSWNHISLHFVPYLQIPLLPIASIHFLPRVYVLYSIFHVLASLFLIYPPSESFSFPHILTIYLFIVLSSIHLKFCQSIHTLKIKKKICNTSSLKVEQFPRGTSDRLFSASCRYF